MTYCSAVLLHSGVHACMRVHPPTGPQEQADTLLPSTMLPETEPVCMPGLWLPHTVPLHQHLSCLMRTHPVSSVAAQPTANTEPPQVTRL
jgi:hypothetical protein